MTESGQAGAPTPGEHGDGTGQHGDLARSVSGWAPPTADWSRGGDAGREPAWRQPDPTGGWRASSPRYGDLPGPLPGLSTEEPSSRVNGRPHVNGVHHAGEETRAARQTPVSAPPLDEPGRYAGDDRPVVPAQRPAPAGEQPSAEAEPGPVRPASDDPPATRSSRRAEGSVPSSAPPALQVPPVGAAPSGFEVPPGFHAPTADRSTTEQPPSLSRGWADRFPPEPPAGKRSAAEPPAPEPAGQTPAEEPEWPATSWNEPSWGNGWAPQWYRDDEPVARRAREDRAAGWAAEPGPAYEPVRGQPAGPYEPVRPESTPAYDGTRAEQGPAYEARRAEPEPRPTHEPTARESVDRPGWSGAAPLNTPFSAPPHTAPTSAPPGPAGAPTSAPPGRAAAPASAPPYVAPTSAPPVRSAAPASSPPHPAPASAPPYAAPAGDPPTAYEPPSFRAEQERGGTPFRLRPVDAPATPRPGRAGHPPTPAATGPTPATSGVPRPDPTPAAPAPTSAPPYAARRSAPEPVPTAEPVADTRPAERAPAVLPQRVPAEPDVPVVPEPPAVEPSAETPELARIATHLRRDDEPAPLRERPEGFDVNAILDAVREVAGVRDAALRRTPAGAHSLRLDLADGADPAEVSRQVARLLQERMGLAAAPQNVPGLPPVPPPPVRRRSAEVRAAESRLGAADADAGAAAEASTADDREPRAGESQVTRHPEGRAARRAAAAGEDQTAPTAQDASRTATEPPRRRRQAALHRGRAAVDEASLAAAPAGTPASSAAMLGTSYSGGQMTTTETAPSRPLDTGGAPGPRVVIDHVQVSTFGLDATVEVRLIAGGETAEGHATGPAVDGYVFRLCAVAAAAAVDELLRGPAGSSDGGRCFVEHAAVVPFGNCEVATVVVLLVCDGWVEQLAGSALVAGDPRQAVVRATLAAINRRLEALLA